MTSNQRAERRREEKARVKANSISETHLRQEQERENTIRELEKELKFKLDNMKGPASEWRPIKERFRPLPEQGDEHTDVYLDTKTGKRIYYPITMYQTQ